MPHFTIYNPDNAPEGSRPALSALKGVFGFVPNLAGAMGGSPPLINAFASVFKSARTGSFSEADLQVLLLTNAVANACEWAVAFHTHHALEHGVPHADVEAIRHGALPSDARHAALSALARGLIERRGHVEPAALQAFLDAGFEPPQVLEVILAVSASTLTNYAGSVARPPLEAAIQPYAWSARH